MVILKKNNNNQPIKYIPTMQRNKKTFKGQNIFIGIDVHKKNWQVSVITESGFTENLSIQSSAKALFEFLKRHYPEGTYRAVYESGFSGFATYYALTDLGIDCIVVHAADIPSTQYESAMKSDRIDAVRLAKALRAGLLRSIYIRPRHNLDDRSVVRLRKTFQIQLGGYKTRIKHLLHSNGVELPERFMRSGTHWSKAFMSWLRRDVRLLSETHESLELLLLQVDSLRGNLLEATRRIRAMSRTERYRENCSLLMSIPGIGQIVAMSLLTEICDFNRFDNERQFASYLGLVPTCHSSGEKVAHGEMTFRGNKHIGPQLVEASWILIARDREMGRAYAEYRRRMTGQEAIIRIARKLSNVILSVLKTRKQYEPYRRDM